MDTSPYSYSSPLGTDAEQFAIGSVTTVAKMDKAAPETSVWHFDRVIASEPAHARQVLDEMLSQLEAQHWHQRDIFAIHLAAEEALVNAIRHGNRADKRKCIHVGCR